MTRHRKIISVAHDPGGARAVFPLLQMLQENGYPVLAIAAGPAREIAAEEFSGIPQLRLEDEVSAADLLRVLNDNAASLLISAAGLYNRIEHTTRRAARGAGVPVVAVLDWWCFFGERFRRRSGSGQFENSRPDLVLALDETSRADLIAEGFDPGEILVTGAMNLESSARRLAIHSSHRGDLRSRFGVAADADCAVFFSEPYIRASDGLPWDGDGGYFNAAGDPILGYTAGGMLEEVVGALAQCYDDGKVTVLLVKPHPMEHVPSLQEVVRKYSAPGIKIRLVENSDPLELCAAGDVFFGMTSIVLIEASLSGKPVLSVQIGLPDADKDAFIGNRFGFTRPIYDTESLARRVQEWRGGGLGRVHRKTDLPIGGATQNALDALARKGLI